MAIPADLATDPGRLIPALFLAATALFLLSGRMSARWRRGIMIAAVATYGTLLAWVVLWVALRLLR